MKKLMPHMAIAIQILAALVMAVPSQGQTSPARTYKEVVLHSFTCEASDGCLPWGGLIRDAAGTLYGTTVAGGLTGGPCLNGNGCGTIYKVDKSGKETLLYSFTGGTDGAAPIGSLVLDDQGNLYGTAQEGGSQSQACESDGIHYGCGVVYKLDPKGNLTVLYSFTDAPPTFGPAAGLVRDKAGNLYGTTWEGGDYQLGSVFKVDAKGNYTLVHSFNYWDGLWGYLEPLTIDASGNVYGMTTYGGSGGWGTVYKVDPSSKLSVLYSFTGTKDGSFPSGNLARDKAGNLFGSTYEGGSTYGNNGSGVVFKLSQAGKVSVLYTFPQGSGSYGGGMIVDDAGNVYGTTSFSGANNRGSVFEIDRAGKETDLYSFTGGTDGDSPWAPVIRDANGNLYGTTHDGGASNVGVVFELIPQ